MGLVLNPFTHRKILKKGVPGQATIVSMGALDRGATSFNLPMTLHVYVEGWTPYEVSDQWMVKASDTIGLSGWIPVMVDPEERDKVAIDWDGVRANHDQEVAARQQALAQQGPVGELGGPGVSANVFFQQQSPPVLQDTDPIARLERLAALKASGVLTEEEFQQQKRRILEESG
jgi:hypothetical protein